ncbi:28S ribosomal protein S18b, mitochondrial [Pectinophora gossypiella]|uniref:28S ribosomal protein S18b, mitochondrial n=1 Tax=Pectinophora gossypiella TaxID=13191 RepID=UPI00214E65CA|nr:28S ribosomal protein S18b, mitochondrial [Pectinophora gossypiella]
MALSSNIGSLIRRIALVDIRSIRFYSNQVEGVAGEEEQNVVDPTKDRTKIIPVETSMKYMNSKAYQETYGEKPVWVLYRRNHKGGVAPRNTRKSCVRNGVISTGNPCPICRDEYLVLDHRNTKLLQQFISEYTGQILEPFNTGVCRKKHKELLVAIERARDQGYLTYDVPFREYDYSLYNKNTTS